MNADDLDHLALRIATRLRDEECPHGLPSRVVSLHPVAPWGEGATCKPLCDACVMNAVREVLSAKAQEIAS